MAVVARQRKNGTTTYYAVREWQGRQMWERVGPVKRQAEIRDRAMAKEIKAGTYQPPEGRRAWTVGEFAAVWAMVRTNASAPEEQRIVRNHIQGTDWLSETKLDELRPKQVMRWVEELWAKGLKQKTVKNYVAVLRQVYAAAHFQELVTHQPVQLPRGTLRVTDAAVKEVYEISECLVLMRHHSIPWPIRVLNALCILGGLREGEACGRRWMDIDPHAEPLAAMHVHDQYGGQPLKTKQPRMVPVHPELRRILEDWGSEGWELYVGRKPTPEDYIVPNREKRASKPHHTRSTYRNAFMRACESSGVRHRTLHSTRHSFITHCRRGGARKDVLEKITHNAKGEVIDQYTHFDWAPLCEAVKCFRLDSPPALPQSGNNPLKLGGSRGGTGMGFLALSPASVRFGSLNEGGSSPGAGAEKHRENRGAANPRPASRQGAGGILDYLAERTRDRKRRAQTLSQVEPEAGNRSLDVARALETALSGDEAATLRNLSKAARRDDGEGES